MSGGDYRWQRKVNQEVGGRISYTTTGVSGASVVSGGTGTASGAIFVQHLEVVVTTGAGVTWNFIDSSGSQTVAGPLDMSTANVRFSYDFGDVGLQLPTGASLQVSGSASGAAANVQWVGYKKYMGGASVGFFPASGSSGSTP